MHSTGTGVLDPESRMLFGLKMLGGEDTLGLDI